MINLDRENDFVINKYDKICQIVFKKIEEAELISAEELDESERGTGGFGSTGK
ncbi:MAG: Deoxyuridine 5'-triphosphate nucleotidohydrolase [Actinobacteria bacterium ADurb.Bin346]|nr:MAG: Deoxyuridine 5'-triphosphate nucleotidohydrolase [Actinobacteria bacterium ADurb.Bin346]